MIGLANFILIVFATFWGCMIANILTGYLALMGERQRLERERNEGKKSG